VEVPFIKVKLSQALTATEGGCVVDTGRVVSWSGPLLAWGCLL